jgi:hypothetical protein
MRLANDKRDGDRHDDRRRGSGISIRDADGGDTFSTDVATLALGGTPAMRSV